MKQELIIKTNNLQLLICYKVMLIRDSILDVHARFLNVIIN